VAGILARIVLVAGFCLGAIGASGFAEPVEPRAWPMFLIGVGATVVGGLALKIHTRRAASARSESGLSREGLGADLERLAREVVRLDEEREDLDPVDFCARIDALLVGPYFEIGGRSEDYARVLGAARHARIWEGFAVSERLLARAWSIATDGHLEEARAELPRARAQILAAAEEARWG
jgi:hypothetical protein